MVICVAFLTVFDTWKLKIPSKIKIHIWFHFNALRVRHNLLIRGISGEISCPFCSLCPEDIMHFSGFVHVLVRYGKQLDCGVLLVVLKVVLLLIYSAGWRIMEGRMSSSFFSYYAGACG